MVNPSTPSNNDSLKLKPGTLSPPFKSILRLMFISLFLLFVGQSSLARLIDEPKSSNENSTHYSYSNSISTSSSPGSLTTSSGTDSQVSSPTFEDSPRMEGSPPTFSSSDFIKERDERQHFFQLKDMNELHSREESKVIGGNVYGIHIREEGGNGKDGNSKSSHGKDGKDSEVDEVGNGRGHSVHNGERPNAMDSMGLGLGILGHSSTLQSRGFEGKVASHHHRHHHGRHGRPSHLEPPKESEVIKLGGSIDSSGDTSSSSSVGIEKRHKHYKGKGTYFKPGMGACGHHNDANDLIVALDRSQYSGGRHCGNFLNVCHQDRCVRVKIVDECPECHYGSLDLSPAAFSKLAPKSKGIIGITWSFSS